MICPHCKKEVPDLKICLGSGFPMKPLPSPAGGIIRFGKYDWRVLEKQNGRALILSEKVIEKRAYHDQNVDVTWEDCAMRRFLNGEFYNSFSESDRARIVETKIVNHDNPWYGTNGGNPTNDRIFLLSIQEVVKYFGDSGQLKNKNRNPGFDWLKEEYVFWISDKYDTARIALDTSGKPCWWLLRTPGAYNNCTPVGVLGNDDEFDSAGGINVGSINDNIVDGYYSSVLTESTGVSTNKDSGVRPALWLKM